MRSHIIASVIDRRNFKDILVLLAKTHFDFDVHAEATYEWLSQICRRSGDPLLAAKADMIGSYMIDARALSERFAINEWSATAS